MLLSRQQAAACPSEIPEIQTSEFQILVMFLNEKNLMDGSKTRLKVYTIF